MVKEQKEKKPVAIKNGTAALILQYNKIKDLNSSEARRIRKQLRDMGTSIREVLDDKPKVEKKTVVKEAPAKATTKKKVIVTDDDEGED